MIRMPMLWQRLKTLLRGLIPVTPLPPEPTLYHTCARRRARRLILLGLIAFLSVLFLRCYLQNGLGPSPSPRAPRPYHPAS